MHCEVCWVMVFMVVRWIYVAPSTGCELVFCGFCAESSFAMGLPPSMCVDGVQLTYFGILITIASSCIHLNVYWLSSLNQCIWYPFMRFMNIYGNYMCSLIVTLCCSSHTVCTAFMAIKLKVQSGSFVVNVPFWFLKTLEMKCAFQVDKVALFAFLMV